MIDFVLWTSMIGAAPLVLGIALELAVGAGDRAYSARMRRSHETEPWHP
jgi:hypothetical protein